MEKKKTINNKTHFLKTDTFKFGESRMFSQKNPNVIFVQYITQSYCKNVVWLYCKFNLTIKTWRRRQRSGDTLLSDPFVSQQHTNKQTARQHVSCMEARLCQEKSVDLHSIFQQQDKVLYMGRTGSKTRDKTIQKHTYQQDFKPLMNSYASLNGKK